jgi:hypothetical protein
MTIIISVQITAIGFQALLDGSFASTIQTFNYNYFGWKGRDNLFPEGSHINTVLSSLCERSRLNRSDQ